MGATGRKRTAARASQCSPSKAELRHLDARCHVWERRAEQHLLRSQKQRGATSGSDAPNRSDGTRLILPSEHGRFLYAFVHVCLTAKDKRLTGRTVRASGRSRVFIAEGSHCFIFDRWKEGALRAGPTPVYGALMAIRLAYDSPPSLSASGSCAVSLSH